MTFIWSIRLSVAKVMFNFFGYLSPALNSTKAIVNNDEEGIREYLTYWSVFGLLLYIEFILNFFSALKNWPPESKVAFILWLTLPQFQGAFRIYSFVLKPYFEKYEDEIDKHISDLSKNVSEKAHKHAQTILWQVFLAPNDGLLCALSLSSSSIVTSFLYQREKGGEIDKDIIEGQKGRSADDEQQLIGKRPTSFSLKTQLLANFSEMLVEGIYADVKQLDSAAHGGMQLCRVSLVLRGFYLNIVQQNIETTIDTNVDTNIDLNINMNLNAPASTTHTSSISSISLLVPIFLIKQITSDKFDSNLIVVLFNSYSHPLPMAVSAAVYMKVEDEEEGEALLAGLSVLYADVKKKTTMRLSRAFLLISNNYLSAAFSKWQRCV